MSFLKEFDYLILVLESVPGTLESVAQADRNLCIVGGTAEFQETPEFDDETSKCANGEHGENLSIFGLEPGAVSFNLRYTNAAANTTAPNMEKCFESCGLKPAVIANGRSYEPLLEYDKKTVSIYAYERQSGTASQYKVHTYAGCMGNMIMTPEGVNKPIMLTFNYLGKVAGNPTDETTVPAAGTLDTAIPIKFAPAIVDYGTYKKQEVSTFSFDLGNEVMPLYDQGETSGIAYYHIVSRKPRYNMNPYGVQVATQDLYGIMKDMTENSLRVAIPTNDPKFVLEAPVCQLLAKTKEEREGLNANNITLKFEKNGTVDTNLSAEATFQLIHGFRQFIYDLITTDIPFYAIFDSNGYLYVGYGPATTIDRVAVFDPYGIWVRDIGIGTITGVLGLDIDSTDNVYVSDSSNVVFVFNTAGTLMGTIGSSGSGDGQFSVPKSVAVHSNGNVYVVDNGNDRVQVFTVASYIYSFSTKFGTTGTGNGEFDSPLAIAKNSTDGFYVVDSGNNRVEEFDDTGAYQSEFGTTGSGTGEFQFPTSIVIDSVNKIYVSDFTNNNVQQFNAAGVYVATIGSSGTEVMEFSSLRGLGINNLDHIAAADAGNNRVQVFKF